MRKFAYFFLSTSLILVCAATGIAQSRVVTEEVRERERERRRALDNPANNPFKVEPYDPLKPPPPPPPSPLRATVDLRVVGIADGDTIIITNTANQPLRIRLQGIDAPEAGQSFSNEAQQLLEKLVTGKTVSLEFDPHGKPDAEGRIVAKVYLEGRDIGLEQIKAGLAWYCKDYNKELSESDRYTYPEAEKEARNAKRGLWRESAPRPPWKYRKSKDEG
jgi:endonuclease YncB( thermonuclease family)